MIVCVGECTFSPLNDKQLNRPELFLEQRAGWASGALVVCQSMSCLLPQIVTQSHNIQLSLGWAPSNNLQPTTGLRGPELLQPCCWTAAPLITQASVCAYNSCLRYAQGLTMSEGDSNKLSKFKNVLKCFKCTY